MNCTPRVQHAAAILAACAAFVAATTMAPLAAARPPGPGCGDVWGARVQGAPPFYPGDRGGVYLWHDNGFHLRVTHRGDGERVYAGTIVSPTPMRVTPVDLEPNDQLNLSPDGRTISFMFTNFGRTDGADFVTDCAEFLTVGPLTADNVALPTDRIYLGANEIRPENNPLTIHRHDQ
ncbi:MAG: hypothetical protein NVS4B6_17200 [Mycobacterium sp.]